MKYRLNVFGQKIFDRPQTLFNHVADTSSKIKTIIELGIVIVALLAMIFINSDVKSEIDELTKEIKKVKGTITQHEEGSNGREAEKIE